MKQHNDVKDDGAANTNKPPLFSRWGHWYFLVLFFLLLQIVFFFYLTRYFS